VVDPFWVTLDLLTVCVNLLCNYDIYCCTQVSPLPSRIHVSGLDDIRHMSLNLNTGNVVTIDVTDLSLPANFWWSRGLPGFG
jgi:hypothetical protein